MNLFQIATRGIDLDSLPEQAPEQMQIDTTTSVKAPSDFDKVFSDAGDAYGVDPAILKSMALAESAFNPDIISGKVKSRAGAIGLMQFMKGTADEYGIDPTNPVEAIFGAAAYMRKSLDKFGGDYGRAVASYNSGAGLDAYRHEDWDARLPPETQVYLSRVFGAVDQVGLKPSAPQAKTEATQLPAGVTPSTAGAGRGAVSPGDINTKLTRTVVPDMTAASLAQDIGAGALQIGQVAVKSGGELIRLAAGDRFGKGITDFAERGIKATQDVVGSDRAAAQRQNLAADMADDSVGLADLVANNKGALADQILPTLGSMAIPLGAAGAAGKLATAGKAAQGLDKAAIAARVASAQQAAGIGATAAQNAASTFAELLDKGVPMQDAYVGAGITVPFSLIAGKLTGGGAEGALIRGMGPAGAARGVAEAALKAPAREGLQEGGEALGQVLGEAGATSTLPTLNAALKQVGTEALLGAVVGGGMSGAQQLVTPRVEAQPTTPTVPEVTPPSQAVTPPNSDAAKTQAVGNIAAAILEAEGAPSPVAPVTPPGKQAASFAQRTAAPTPLPGAVPPANAADAVVRSLVDDIKKKRAQDAEETAQIQQMLAEDDAKAEALAASSMEETARGQATQIAIQARARLVDDLVSSYAEPSGFFASRVLPAVDRQLAVLGRPPLAKEERARVDALLGSTRAFIRPSLPSAPEAPPVLADMGADNAQLESLIKPKKPALSGIGAELAAWKARQQSAKPVQASETPAVAPATQPVTGGLAAEMAALKARSQATTTVDPAKPAPVGIGRDNTPLSEGGKPFKTKAEADTARKLQPMMRVKKQGKGFVLVEKTAAQIAAQEKAARRNLGSVGAGGGPLSAHAFLASQGGLNKSAMADLGFDRNVRVGSKWLFTNTGMTMEGMTEALQQNGYVQGTEQNPAIEMVRRSANGQPQYTAEGWDQIAQAEATARFEDHLAAQQDAMAEDEDFDPFSPDAIAGEFEGDDLVVAGYDAAQDPIKQEVAALLAQLEALGKDTESLRERVAQETSNLSEQDYYERLKQRAIGALNEATGGGSTGNNRGNAGEGRGQEAQPRSGGDRRQDDGREGAPGADGEGLTAYTPEEVTARQDAAAQAEATAKRAEEAAARAEAAAKQASEIAQRSVSAADTFELGGNAEDNLSGQEGLRFSRKASGVSVGFKPGTKFLQATSDAGMVGGTVKDGVLRITFSEVDESQRGQGNGLKLYQALIDQALDDGLKVTSDSTVEAEAVRVYEALGRRGYTVTRLDGGTTKDGAAYGVGATQPAFEVSRSDGVRRSFAGASAATADRMSLMAAQDRLDAGENAEVVRQETGWFKGVDGRWRFEISDNEAKVDATLLTNLARGGFDARPIEFVTYRQEADGTYSLSMSPAKPTRTSDFVSLSGVPESLLPSLLPTQAQEAIQRGDGEADIIGPNLDDAKRVRAPFQFEGFNALPLGVVMDHPKLFAAYPALRDIMVQVDASLGNGATFAEMEYVDGTTGKAIKVGNPRAANVDNVLLHEIQHGIQSIEGFATGGTVQGFVEKQSAALPFDVVSAALDLRTFVDKYSGYGTTLEGIKAKPPAQFRNLPDSAWTLAKTRTTESLQKEYEFSKRAFDPLDSYHRLAGEVEARNTQARQGMSDAERRATPPSATADVADSNVVVVMNGREMAMAPMPVNAVSMESLRSQLDALGVAHSISEGNGIITVSKIVVPQGQRNTGIGTQAMQAIVDHADATGQHIALTPSADFGGSKARLTGFYKRFGFKENKGRNRVFSVSESMVRENPNGKTLFSQSQQSPRTPASTIREAITKAYGNLLNRLEGKGLVSLTQTEEEAIAAAAQARADQNGGDVEAIKQSLRASVLASHHGKTAGMPENNAPELASMDQHALAQYLDEQRSIYSRMKFGSPEAKAQKVHLDQIKLASQRLRDGSPKRQTRPSDDELSATYDTPQSVPSNVVSWLQDNNQILTSDATDAVRWARIINTASDDRYPAGQITLYRATIGNDIRPGDWVTTQREYAERHLSKYLNGGSVVEIQVDGKDVLASPTGNSEEAIYAPLELSVALNEQSTPTSQGVDIRRSADGNLEGFFDPATGKSYLIADNLTAESAPGTLMHEVGIHMAADGKLEPLFDRAANLLKMARDNVFIQRVQSRMDEAGETSNEEAAAYIVTEYENDRAAAPDSVVKWVKDFIADVRAWLFGKGVLLKAGQLTVADIAAVARANANRMAKGDAKGDVRYSKAPNVYEWADRETAPVGAWVKADYKLSDSQPVYQVREMAIEDLYLPELTENGALQPEKRGYVEGYAGRIKAGEKAPAISVIEMENGSMRVVDGHRRVLAAKAAGQTTIRALVSPLVDAAEGRVEATAENIRRSVRGGGQGQLFQQQAVTTWDDLGESKMDSLIYEGQDDRIDLKRVQENIAKAGRSIREEFDARTAETLLPGRLASRTETFMDIEVKPLMRDMAANNVTMEALSDYMLARHAPERNAQIAKVNPDMPDGGAGTNSQGVLMTTQAANDHIAALTTGKRMALELLARRVDTITKGTRELLVAEGLEKADTVKAWEGAYKHYVPLFRDESAETPGHPIGSGISVTGTSSKRATGSTKEVTNMLAHVLMQREAAITRAEKNRVAMSLYGMALSHPNKGFWSTVQPNMKTADIVAELQRMGVDPMDGIAGMDAAPTIRTVDERTNLVVDRPNPMYKKLDNAIVVKVNGEDRVILFNTKNARAMRLAESLKNQHMDAGVVADAMNSVATVTRFMASMLTQYNPAFGMVNAVRDVQGALVNLSSTELAGKQARVLADTPAAVIGIARDLRGDPKRTPWSDLWVQFQEDGGRTGYRDLVASPYERTANIEKDLKRMQNEGKLTAGNAAHAVLDVLGDFNDSLENGVRLAAYKAALDKGMSRPQAAKLARELTVDFNRKGRTGRELGKLYAFLNASIQGNARTLATLVGKHGGKVMAGGFALGVLQALMLAAAGFEEDEIPEFVKARAFIIPVGGKQYVAIPLALGLHVLPNTSRVLTELMMTGGEDWQTRVPTAMAEIVNAANPFGGGGDWTTLHGPLTMLMPTVLDPLLDLGFNRDFTGKPISRTSYNERTPGADMAREGTRRTPSGQVYLGISEAINSLSGGNARKAGTFSPTPEEVRYVLGVAGGGVFRETEKAINAAVMLVRGDEIKATQVPLGSRFVGEVRDEDVQRTRFYKNSRKLEDLEADLKNARKSQDEAEERRLAKDARTDLIGMNNSIQRRITEINRLAKDEIGDRAALARHDASRADLMRALNDEVRKLEKAAQ